MGGEAQSVLFNKYIIAGFTEHCMGIHHSSYIVNTVYPVGPSSQMVSFIKKVIDSF